MAFNINSKPGKVYDTYKKVKDEKKKKEEKTITTTTNKKKSYYDTSRGAAHKKEKAKTQTKTTDNSTQKSPVSFTTETKKAYEDAKTTANSKTTIKSDLSDKDRKTRIKEIESEMTRLNYTLDGLGRANAYTPGKSGKEHLAAKSEEIKKRKAELEAELKSLQRVGTFSASELKQFEIEDAKAEKAKLPSYNPTARIMPHQVDAFKENIETHLETDKEIDLLKGQKGLYKNISKFGDVVNSDTFGGQWRANYRYADLTRDADKAMNEYLRNPTEENRQIAYAYDAFVKEYAKNNEKALDDENVKASWLTKSMAGYLPQFRDQLVPELLGGGIGYLIAGKAGSSIGAGLGSYSQMYDVMRGSVYRTLLAEGVDEQTALEAAEDEALLSALIEGGGTAVSWALSGGGKALEAIGNAATKSVAKGSTNAATKYVANKFLTTTAKKASESALKTAGKVGLGIVGNALSEYGEEFAQQGVSIANKERALNGFDEGLWTASGKVIKDAVTGKNAKNFAEMHEAGKEGFKIGLMFGGANTVVNNSVSRFLNAKTIQEQNEALDFVRNDEETLDTLIEEAKASGEGTVSEKIATEIEKTIEKGKEVTRDQVKRLIASNDVYIKNEEVAADYTEQTTEPDLMQAARETVENRNKQAQNKKRKATVENLDALTADNQQINVEEVKQVTRFGERGARVVTGLANRNGVTFSQAVNMVESAYLAGASGMTLAQVEGQLRNKLQESAFEAGMYDRAMQDAEKQAQVKNATTYEGVFTENEHTKNYTEHDKKMIATVVKVLKMDVSATDKILASITFDAYGDEVYHYANAKHEDGKMEIASHRARNKAIYALVMHESGHRMSQLAPKEFGSLMDALYQRAEKRARGSEFGNTKKDFDNAGLEKKTRDIIEEIAVRELETIFSSAEEFNKWYAEISQNQELKNNWQKFVEWISKVIDEIKTAWEQRNMTAEERAAAKEELTELNRIKDLLASSIKAAEKSATELSNKVNAKQDTTEGNVSTEAKNGADAKGEVDFSLRNSKSGRANDLLLPYDDELTGFIKQRGDYIINNFEDLKNVVNLAFDNRQKQATAYFGIVPYEILENIENNIPNLPKELNGSLFKTGRDYSVAATLDSIRHLAEDKSLSREEIIDYLDRLADTIVEFDTVAFDYYYEKDKKMNGVLFKKTFNDGTVRSFEIVSKKKKSLNLQTIYLENGDYIKKKSANSALMENPSANVRDEEWSNFNGRVPQKSKSVKSDFSLIDPEPNRATSKDTKALLETIEHLKNEFKVTKFAKADPKKLAKLTKNLLKEYSSTADYDETFKAIDEIYQYIANGEDRHPAVWDDLYNRASEIAQSIVESAVVMDDEMYVAYKSLRDYLRRTPIKFDSRYDGVPSGYENFQDFRRHNWGRFNFTKDGVSIDSIYQELSGLYPEFFNPDEQINTADQLERIVDVLEQLRPTEVNPYSQGMTQAVNYLANDIIDRFFDIPQARPTFADKAERRVMAERVKGNKKVEAVRQQKDEKIQKLIERQKDKTKKQIEKLREQRDARVKKEQQKRREAISKMNETQKAKVIRAQIARHAGDLSKKLLRPTDNQHIPEDLKGIVATLLECINLESNYTYDTTSHSYKKNDEGLPTRRTQMFNELKKLYSEIASSVVVDPDLLGDNGLLSDVISLADKRIADMSSTELQTVWDAVRAIEASVNTANRVFSQGKFETILEFAESLIEDNKDKNERVELKKALGKGKKLLLLDMLTPETYFHYLGSAGDSIFRMMRDAQDKHISIMKEVKDFTRKTLKGVDVNSLEKTIHTVKLGGEDVKLSTAQLMELYVLVKRKQGAEHILAGGILPDATENKWSPKLNTKAEPIRNLSTAEISKALSNLTDEQKKIADALQKFVSTTLSEYGNEASMKVYNYEKFLEKNYWTIRTNKQEIMSNVGKDTAVITVANKGMAKGTKANPETSVYIGSIFDTFATHSSDMATYAAWLGTTEDVNRIRNFKSWEDGKIKESVKGILDTVHGIRGSEYLQNLLTDISIGVKGTDNMNPLDSFTGLYKASTIGANIRVIIQQPTAVLRAMDMLDARYLAVVSNPLNGWEKAKKYAPIAQWKDWGHFDINTGRQMKDVLFDNASLLEKTKQVGMWGASMADSLAWGQLWNAVEAETKAKHKALEVGSEEYYETVGKRFTEIVDHTQVVDGIMQRSQAMRNGDALIKMATSFMGEPTKQYNMALAAAYDVKHSKGEARKKAATRLGRTATALAVAGIVNACAQSIIDAMRDDDKEKDYWEKWLDAFIGDEDDKMVQKFGNLGDTFNPLSYVPFAKDIVSIFSGYDVKRMDMEAISKVTNATVNMYKAVTGTGKYTIAEASAQLFAEASRLWGLPVANVKRDVKSLVTSVATQTDNYLLQYRMEKAMLEINYAGNSKNFMDILFNAYNNDRKAYEFIYSDLLKSGYDADKIKNGMETRMKKAEGVKKSSDLAKRYMSPTTEKKYNSSLTQIKKSDTWKSANATQRKDAKADLYNYLTSTSNEMKETRAEAKAHGVDETEYTLWKLALDMVDQPKGQEGHGGYDSKEKAKAINSLDFGDDEIAYFFGLGLQESAKQEIDEVMRAGIDMEDYVNFKAAVSDMEADKNANGKSIPNSKKRKVVNYLNNADLTDEEWRYFYYEIMNYKK